MAAIFTVMFAGPAAACEEPACDQDATWTYDWNGTNTVTASLTVDAASGGLCETKTLQASSYKVSSGWDGVNWNSSAVPQQLFNHQLIEFSAGTMTESKSATLLIPACGPYQVDLYSGEPQVEVTWPTGHAGFIKGGLVRQDACPTAVVPVGPTHTEPTCDADGVVTLPPVSDAYTLRESDLNGATIYTAEVNFGYGFAPGVTTVWTIDIAQLASDNEACLPDVITEDAITTVNLTPTPPTCDVDGSLTLPQGEGYTWAGPSVLGVGTHTVIATAHAGWVFEDNSTVVERTVIVASMTGPQSSDAAGKCFVAPVVVPPKDVPPVVVPPVVDQPVVVPPVVTPAVLVASTNPTVSSSRVLAYTGIDGLPWLIFGAAGLIGLGGLALTRTARLRRIGARA